MKSKQPKGFGSAKRKAASLAKDVNQVSHLVNEATAKAKNNRHAIKRFAEALNTLLRLVKAWRKGNYKKVPRRTILWAIATIVYFVNPFDVVPDFFPVVGYLDDAAVLGFVMNSIEQDIDDFQAWENTKKRK